MTRFAFDAQDTRTPDRNAAIRFVELAGQRWGRNNSVDFAKSEGIELNDEHWAVIMYLRRYYLKHGRPIKAQTLENALNEHFFALGGNDYLHRLFPGGPVKQGCRFANLINL